MFWVLTMFGMSAMVCFGQSPLKRQVRGVSMRLQFKCNDLLYSGQCHAGVMQGYPAHEIAVMYTPASGTFKFWVLTDKLMGKRLSDYGRSDAAK